MPDQHTAVTQAPPLQMVTYNTYYRCRTASLPVKLPSVRLNSVVYFYCHPRCELLPKGINSSFSPNILSLLKSASYGFSALRGHQRAVQWRTFQMIKRKQHGSQQTGRANGDLIRLCLRPKAMRRRVPLNTKLCLCDFASLLLQGMFGAPGEVVVEFEKEKSQRFPQDSWRPYSQ